MMRMQPTSGPRLWAALAVVHVLQISHIPRALAGWAGRPGGGGDDTYQFAPGFGQQLPATLTSSGKGVQLSFPASPGAWDTALVGVRLRAQPGEPWVELSVGAARVRQYLDPGARGLRWLNLTGLRQQLVTGAVLELSTHAASIEPGPATVRLFSSKPSLDGRILVLSPHPDDAEIGAFGLYTDRNATIVTVTSGNAGDANYATDFPDLAEQYQWKGYLRAVDSVTVPWQGGIPPQRCFNLGYFDARLEQMRDRPRDVIPEMYGSNTDTGVYRRANVGRLLPVGPRPNSWSNLVDDLVKILRKVRPAVIVMPHPMLDDHADHQNVAVAAVEALQRWKQPVKFLLYTNHAALNLYPYGPAGTTISLPPWSGPALAVQGIYAHPVPPALQRRKLYALESMHDLRLSPAEQKTCTPPGARAEATRLPALCLRLPAPRPPPRGDLLRFRPQGVERTDVDLSGGAQAEDRSRSLIRSLD